MRQKREKLSVILITQNEARQVAACLASVAWADELIVVDGGSTDRTVEIARAFTSCVYENPWPGFAAQKQFALSKATKPWVLSIDSDERVPPALREEILRVLSSPAPEVAGYYIPRLSTFLGKYIYHSGWCPGYQLRLFRREQARVTEAAVHEGFVVEGEVAHLENHLLHFTHRSLRESIDRLNRYSTLEAHERAQRQRVHWWQFWTHPVAAFYNKYIALQGFRDGFRGFLLACITAMVKMALYMKVWERQRRE